MKKPARPLLWATASDELRERVKKIAAREGRTLSNLVGRYVKEGVARDEQRVDTARNYDQSA